MKQVFDEEDIKGKTIIERQAYYSHQAMYGNNKDDRSLILRVKTEKPVISE